MEAAAILAIIDGALTILEKAAPELQKLFTSGQISVEDQKARKDRIDALSGSETFSGPEWQVEK